jgi:Rod binding domain-containing protein
MSQMSGVNMALDPSRIATASTEQRRAMLRQAAGEAVSLTFVGEMLKMSRNSALQGKFGHGGQGEKMFRAQLDQQLAELVGQRMKNGLTETIYSRFAGSV